MKVWSWIAITAALVVSVWSLSVVHMMPLGICDAIYEPIVAKLQTAHSREDAGQFAGQVCAWAGNGVEAIKWFATIPLILTNAVLGVVLWVRLRKKPSAPGNGPAPQ